MIGPTPKLALDFTTATLDPSVSFPDQVIQPPLTTSLRCAAGLPHLSGGEQCTGNVAAIVCPILPKRYSIYAGFRCVM